VVDQVISLGVQSGWLLDIGTGPGGIPLKIAGRFPDLRAVGVDRSPRMIRTARNAAARRGFGNRVSFLLADASRLCFPDASFDFVLSNSLLYHLKQPLLVFEEMARVSKPQGVILLRDLRRPARLVFLFHVHWYGRFYSGVMKKLYVDSVRSAYTEGELSDLLRPSALANARIFRYKRTHLGFLRQGRGATHRPT
jgi:ubiquinone/menaquinone biosynthesis C-methylase UbiE